MSKRPSANLISTILFDADGVMQLTDDGWRETLVGLLGDRAAVDGERFISAIQMAEAPTMDGKTDIGEAMSGVLRKFSVSADVDDILDVWTKIQSSPDMVQAVLDLRRQGVMCCLATNQHSRRAKWMRDNLRFGAVFNEQFYSCELGLAKPDPAYFSMILERLDVDPSTVLFVDDTETNVIGATTTGMHAAVFPRHGGRPALEKILSGYAVVNKRAA